MKRIALAVVLVVSLATPAWAGYEEGVAAYGRGDFPAALREFEDLALQGDAAAQFYLGIMYDRGGGVAQDDGEAVKWHRLAAAQGSAKALNNIGLLYQNGFDVPRDLAKAYAWYSLAADSFGPGRQREQAARKRDGVAKEISPQQLGRARRLARAWSPGTAAIAAASTPTRAFVALVQDKLQRSGHDPGPVDGLMGFATRAAIRAFQAARQIPITGEISEELLRELDTASLERTARPPTPGSSVPAAPTGALVVRVQEKLARSRHDPGPADGIVGPKTRAAIRAFQATKDIPVTGEVSAELLRELDTASLERTARPPTPGSSVPAAPTGALVVRVQEKLARSGHDPGPADGIMGPKTRAAIRAFQAAKDIPVTGEVSAELLRELEITSAD